MHHEPIFLYKKWIYVFWIKTLFNLHNSLKDKVINLILSINKCMVLILNHFSLFYLTFQRSKYLEQYLKVKTKRSENTFLKMSYFFLLSVLAFVQRFFRGEYDLSRRFIIIKLSCLYL